MSTEQQLPEGAPLQMPRTPPLLPAIVRFIVAGFWVFASFWVSGLIYSVFPGRNLIPGVLFRLITCLLTLGGFAFFLRVLDFNSAPLLPALGLPLDSTAARQLVSGTVLGGFLITVGITAIGIFGGMTLHLRHGRMLAARALLVVVMLLLAALMEELAFRGYPFQKLTQSVGAFWAVLVLSALFGAVHLMNPESQGWLSWGFWNTVLVGALFALARIRTGSLWYPVGLHFGWNLFQGAVFGLPVSGLREFATFFSGEAQGSARLTGGSYGLEASATCTLLLIAALPMVWWFTSARRMQHRYEPVQSPGPSI